MTSPGAVLDGVPAELLVVVGTFGMVLALLGVGAALSPRSRRQLRFLADRTGIGPGLGSLLVVAAVGSFASVFALGGTTSGRYDLPLAAAFVLHGAGLFLLADAAGSVPDYLAARRAPDRSAAAVEPGERVAVDGEAVVDDPLETPFTGAEAVCYRARVMERHGESDAAIGAEDRGVGGNWRVEGRTDGRVPFRVVDDDGAVQVRPDGAELRLEDSGEVAVGRDDDLPDRIRTFVTDPDTPVGFGAHARRYVEAAVRPGDRVAVVGRATDDDGRTVVDGRAGDAVVAPGSVAAYRRRLRRRVVGSAGGGLALAVLGYAAMLWAAGAA